MSKVCKTCKVDKPYEEFNLKGNTPDGRDYHCRACKSAYNAKRYREGYAQKQRENSIKAKYGLAWSDLEGMYSAQAGGCAVCRRKLSLELASYEDKIKTARVDHCHTTGKVRGLLCDWCNTGLGRFFDNPTLLEQAAAYLRRAYV